MNFWICFFIGVAIKIAVLVSWHTNPVSLCKSNDIQFEIQRRCSYLKNVDLDFVPLVLKLYPIQFFISLPLEIKLTMGQLLTFFLCNSWTFLSYWLIYFGYSANYNAREAFVIIFLIFSDLRNCLRSVGTIVITTESDWNSLKIILIKQFLSKATIFCCFHVFSVRSPQIFQVQAKISTIGPVFPEYLSVSDNCDTKEYRYLNKVIH